MEKGKLLYEESEKHIKERQKFRMKLLLIMYVAIIFFSCFGVISYIFYLMQYSFGIIVTIIMIILPLSAFIWPFRNIIYLSKKPLRIYENGYDIPIKFDSKSKHKYIKFDDLEKAIIHIGDYIYSLDKDFKIF